eukprot:14397765-Alexandrium_andersonii.AAC.1
MASALMRASPVFAAALETTPIRPAERNPPRMSWAVTGGAPLRIFPRGLPRGIEPRRLASGATTSASRRGRGVQGTVE